MMDGVIISNRHGIITFANHTACAMLGYADKELEGHPVEMLMPEAFRHAHLSQRADYMDHPHQRFMDPNKRFLILRKDGSEFPATIGLNPVELDGESLVCVSFQDLSQQEAEAIQREQSQKLEALGEMVSGIAHNFNNVIAGISGQAYLLGKHEQLSEKGAGRVESVNALCSQAADIIKQLMTYARHQSDEYNDFSLADIMHDVEAITKITAPEKISIHIDVEKSDARMHGSANQIEQTMLNLINNAVQAIGDAEGSIAITAKHCSGHDCSFKPCLVNRSDSASMLCVQVCDSGQGISEQHLHRIFDPFFTTKPKGQGTGLGLSTSYGIIKKHGGDIAVHSKEGEGSTFQFNLPVVAGARKTKKTAAVLTPVVTNQTASILIIDDEPSICNMLADILKGFGYSTLTAIDGQQGVEMFTQHQQNIDLVLCDIAMPKLDGHEVLAEIRVIAPNMPFLFITGYEDSSMNGVIGDDKTKVILKPFDFAMFSHEVNSLIKG
jgi:PAS domain S-box-containing protein